MYDAVSGTAKKRVPPAEPAAPATIAEVGKAINGTLKFSQRPDVVGQSIGRMVKRTGVDTTMNNALRDGAEWAWIPNGDTCAFCLTLASRGWQRASKKAIKNGHAEHIHANCDCTYAVRFDGKSTVEGYDPDALLDQYYSAEGFGPKDKINYMRRQQYAANKEGINVRKRTVSAENRERSLPYAIYFEYNGDRGFIPQNTIIENPKTIAGKRTDSILKDRKRLAAVYGGEEEEWEKRAGKVTNDKYEFDIHWYELDSAIYEPKIKYTKERKN